MRIPSLVAVCLSFVCAPSIGDAAKLGRHPGEVQISWENWAVATPKIHQYGAFTPTGKPDPAAVAACRQVTSDTAIACLRSASKSANLR